MQDMISHIILPSVLAAIMFAMGLGLKMSDFQRVLIRPKACFLGLALQTLFLPVLALLIIVILPLSQTAAAGLFLVSLCPGGATSNLFSYLARGDVALSVTLTGFVSLLSPFVLPIAFAAFIHFTGSTQLGFSLPLLPAIKQLAMITLLPIILGMTIRQLAPVKSKQIEPMLKKISAIAMVVLVVVLIATNFNAIKNMIDINMFAVLLLAITAILSTNIITQQLKLSSDTQRTITLEVGIQNAGTAMMISFSILHKPELAAIPLLYGLFMNIPAFAFVAWVLKRDVYKQNSSLINT